MIVTFTFTKTFIKKKMMIWLCIENKIFAIAKSKFFKENINFQGQIQSFLVQLRIKNVCFHGKNDPFPDSRVQRSFRK